MPLRVPVASAVIGWAVDRASDQEAVAAAFPRLQEWLSGVGEPPTFRQLEQLAVRTRTPLGYLLMDSPPALKLPVPDFREGYSNHQLGDPSPDLLAVVHQSIRRQEWYRDYAIENALAPVEVVGSAASWSPLEAAADMRAKLGYEVSERRGSWSDQRKALLSAFESLGGLTVATSMVGNNTHRLLDVEEFRGFSLVDPLAPLVFVNTRQTINGQIFTLGHEFAHVWRGVSGVSLEDPEWEPQGDVERWCNAVASEFLVPRLDLRARFGEVRDLDLVEQLERLARVYRCGTLVVLQALRTNKLRQFDDFRADNDAEKDRLKKLADDRESGDSGRGQFIYNQPFRIGERLSRALIGDAISGRTAVNEAVHLMSLKSLSNFDNYASYLGIRA